MQTVRGSWTAIRGNGYVQTAAQKRWRSSRVSYPPTEAKLSGSQSVPWRRKTQRLDSRTAQACSQSAFRTVFVRDGKAAESPTTVKEVLEHVEWIDYELEVQAWMRRRVTGMTTDEPVAKDT